MKSFDVIDYGREKGFLLKGNQYNGLIPYGEISLMIATIDFNEIGEITKEYREGVEIHHNGKIQYDRNKLTPNYKYLFLTSRIYRCLEENCKSFSKDIIPIIIDFVSLGDEEVFTKKSNVLDEEFDIFIKGVFCIPGVLSLNKCFQDCILSILRREQNLEGAEEFFSEVKMTTSLKVNSDDSVSIIYHFTDVISFVLLDLQKYLDSNKVINNCERCGRPYFPTSGNNKRYCRFPNKGTNKDCAQLQRLIFDEFALVCRKARSNQKGFVENALKSETKKDQKIKRKYDYDIEKLNSEYESWKEELCKVRKECKDNNDLQGLIDWVEKSKFKIKRLEELGIAIRK
ncbi:MAG: DUF6076 domain-containing protein [Lacrimispora sp.]|uniref:DUF6076 domain-containing protein n=1 Tax=Lacrimispora sp. TaxID=2719234 RepID=UPI0039E34D39